MTIVGVDHTSFTVSDLDTAVEWFTTLLGDGPIVRKRSTDAYMSALVGYPDTELEYAYFALPGGTMLELVEYTNPQSGRVELEPRNVGVAHICLTVDDIHAQVERLAPISQLRAPQPVGKTAGINRGGWGIYLQGPDGITIELTQPPPKAAD